MENTNEKMLAALRKAIDEGDASPDVEDFDEEQFLKELKNKWAEKTED